MTNSSEVFHSLNAIGGELIEKFAKQTSEMNEKCRWERWRVLLRWFGQLARQLLICRYIIVHQNILNITAAARFGGASRRARQLSTLSFQGIACNGSQIFAQSLLSTPPTTHLTMDYFFWSVPPLAYFVPFVQYNLLAKCTVTVEDYSPLVSVA